jgi:mannitol/fructose-specific phosphotransferase system IIA component (Ntr-type)
MRESRIHNYQPKYRAPLYPWLQILGIGGYGILLFKIGALPLLIAASFLGAGLIWYLVYARSRVEREFALIHVLERVTARELTSYSLETELKEILRERDEIVEDRFDRVIKESVVVDIDEPLGVGEFFDRVAGVLSPEVDTDEQELAKLFMEREKASATVIRPGFAIPHVIVEGENVFKILLARCRSGVSFSEGAPEVRVVFALAVSRDERNFYLRALSAIAQIAQEKEFDRAWLGARRAEELKDIVLLGERRRLAS